MSACSAPTSPAAARPVRVQLLAQSAALRTALRRALASSGGTLSAEWTRAADARSAASAARPDAVVLDASLPGLNGLGLLRQIAASDPAVPVVVVAPDTAEGRNLRSEAMRAGAAGFVLRPETDQPLALKGVAEEIVALIDPRRGRPAAEPRPATAGEAPVPARGGAVRAAPLPEARPRETGASRPAAPRSARGPFSPQVLLVASSTGGPQALIDLFRNLSPAALPLPVLVVQHMPPAFTSILADHLSRATSWRALEAGNDEPLTAGEIRIAPGGHHMVVTGSGAGRRLRLTSTPPVNFCRPSADVLFTSAAEVFGRGVLAVILTGMGNDGAEGAKVIAAAGGVVFAQDKETSVVWGMPGAAVATGIVDKVVPLGGMPQAVEAAVKGVL